MGTGTALALALALALAACGICLAGLVRGWK